MTVAAKLEADVTVTDEERNDARAILAEALVWDNHACMPLRWNDDRFLPELERFRAMSVDVLCLNIGYGEMGVEDHIRSIAAFRHWLAQRPDHYVLAQSVADIDAAKATGRLAILFDLEGTRGIADQISLIQLYYDLGARWMLMAYNRRNLVGDGVHDPDAPQGLTDFGKSVIREMERVGMVACCSHTHERTFFDVLEVATKPVIFSHSNAAAIFDHPRNISDEMIKASAATGGVIGINGVSAFLGNNDISSTNVVRHLDHMVSLVGPEHVGLGLDYVFDRSELTAALEEMRHTFPDDPAYKETPQFVAPEQLLEIVVLLRRLGYERSALEKILGGNHRRIAETCWKPVTGSGS